MSHFSSPPFWVDFKRLGQGTVQSVIYTLIVKRRLTVRIQVIFSVDSRQPSAANLQTPSWSDTTFRERLMSISFIRIPGND